VFPVPGNAICRWCDFAPVCGAEVTAWAAEKKEAHPDIFGIFDKLKEYK
jgi:hypothetical protein